LAVFIMLGVNLEKVDVSIVIAIILLFVYAIQAYRDSKHARKGEDLDPIEMAELRLLLEGKTNVVQGGNWLDNFVVYCRNSHAILSTFFPTSYNPIQGSERVGILFMTACASVGFTALRHAATNKDDFYIDIGMVTVPVLVVDKLLNYLATKEDKAIAERAENIDAEWMPEEVEMRQQFSNREYLLRTFNQRAIVGKTSSGVLCGQYGFKFLMAVCLVLLLIFGASGASSGWLKSWLWAFVLWFAYSLPMFLVFYCREDPFVFIDPEDHGEDLPSVKEVKDLDREKVVEIVNEWSTHQCCYGQTGGENIDIINVTGSCTKKILFSTWGEGRFKVSHEAPYDGGTLYLPLGIDEEEPQTVNGVDNGWYDDREEPDVWHCRIIVPEIGFEDTERSCDIPGTLKVYTCDRCDGSGEIEKTIVEEGEEKIVKEECPKCKGSGLLKSWKKCNAMYGTRYQHHCMDVSECPVFKVEEMKGKPLLPLDERTGLCAITIDKEEDGFDEMAENCPDTSFLPMIQTFKQRHSEIDDPIWSRINKQRYEIELVKIWEVKYNKGEVVNRFWIIGDDGDNGEDEEPGEEAYDIYWPSKEYSPRCLHCLNCFDCNNLGRPKACVDYC